MHSPPPFPLPVTKPEGERRVLGLRHACLVAGIQIRAFHDDPAFCWMIRTRFFRAILARYLIVTGLICAYLLGRIDGWFVQERLVGVCIWMRPGTLPFPTYVQLICFPFAMFLLLFPAAWLRINEYQQAELRMATWEGLDHWFFAGLAVEAEFRGRGIGTELMRAGLPGADAAVRSVILACWSDLVDYYKRLGFTQFDSWSPDDLDDTLHGLNYVADDEAN